MVGTSARRNTNLERFFNKLQHQMNIMTLLPTVLRLLPIKYFDYVLSHYFFNSYRVTKQIEKKSRHIEMLA